MRFLLILLVFVFAASCEKEEITQSTPNPIETYAKQLASPEYLDPLVEGLGQLAKLTDAISVDGPTGGEAEMIFQRRAEALAQKILQREELMASREAVLSYMDEHNLQPEEVVASITLEAEKFIRQSSGGLRQGAQKGLPCYQTYKDTLAIVTITYASCMLTSSLGGNGAGLGGCTVVYLLSLYAADLAYNNCIDEI